MALKLSLTDDATGVTTEYWRLTKLTVDTLARVAMLTLHGYVSREVRDRDGGQPVTSKELRATGEEFDTFFGPAAKGSLYTQAYLYAQSSQSPQPGRPRVPTGEFDDDGNPIEIADTSTPFEGARKA